MVTTQQSKTNPITNPQPSALDRFSLSFEYDKTIQDIRRNVRERTI